MDLRFSTAFYLIGFGVIPVSDPFVDGVSSEEGSCRLEDTER
jgi:hypothetical protein